MGIYDENQDPENGCNGDNPELDDRCIAQIELRENRP
jgi:hypothetical protein